MMTVVNSTGKTATINLHYKTLVTTIVTTIVTIGPASRLSST